MGAGLVKSGRHQGRNCHFSPEREPSSARSASKSGHRWRLVKLERRDRIAVLCSAGFRTCCIADFPVGRASAIRNGENCSSARRFGNPRYSRLGSLRYHCLACRSYSSFGDRVKTSFNKGGRCEPGTARASVLVSRCVPALLRVIFRVVPQCVAVHFRQYPVRNG